MIGRVLFRLIGIVLFAAAAVGVWHLLRAPEEQVGTFAGGGPATAVAVEVAAVERGRVRDIRSFTGSLEPAARFDVAPKTAGRISELAVDIGDRVERGALVARLDDDEAVQQLEQARAELDVARASLTETRSAAEAKQRDYQRVLRLREQQVASAAELDAAESEAKAQDARIRLAEAQVAQREAALRAAQIRLSYATIIADWQETGGERVVGERYVDEGTTISANTPIVSVLDIDTLTAVIFVAERDYPKISLGQTATVHADPFPERSFEGEVARIAPMFRAESRQARVEIRIPNPGHFLKPGMFSRVRIELDRVEDAVLIPTAAVVERGGRTGVFVVDRDASMARFIAVTTGIVDGTRVQVVAPPLDGEVVTLGHHLLGEESPILVSGSGVPVAATDERDTPAASAGRGNP